MKSKLYARNRNLLCEQTIFDVFFYLIIGLQKLFSGNYLKIRFNLAFLFFAMFFTSLNLAQQFNGVFSFAGSAGDVSSLNYNGVAIPNLTVSPLIKNGVTSSGSSNNSRATGWDTGSTDNGAAGGNVNLNKYYEFTITTSSGFTISNPTLSFGVGRSGAGPRRFQWRWNVDNYQNPLLISSANASLNNTSGVLQSTDANSGFTGNVITTTTSEKTTITFRFYAYGAETAGGTGGLHGDLTFGGTLVSSSTPPTISSALTASATYGQAFSYSIVASGSPTTYAASGLPTGLSVNTTTGVITGSPTLAGNFNVSISATNLVGTDTKSLAL